MSKRITLKKGKGSKERPRVVFCESNRFIQVQAIDDESSHTLASLSTNNFVRESGRPFSCKNMSFTLELANKFAEELKKKGYKRIVLDRRNKLYTGKVKAFCETMRGLGIQF